MDVARAAHQYMKPELFQQYLPAPLRAHFPEVFAEVLALT